MPREIYVIPKAFVIFRVSGVVATIPDPPTLRKSHADFLDSDLELGEFAKNIPDRKIFFRSATGIVEYDDDDAGIPSTLVTTNFSILEQGVDLVIKYGTSVIMTIESTGYL